MDSSEKNTKAESTEQKPLNREPSAKTLVDQYVQYRRLSDLIVHDTLIRCSKDSKLTSSYSFLTPQDTSYDRNHGPIPHINGKGHSIRIDGLVKNPLSLTLNQLRSEFAQHEVTCVLECAGNRRHTMRTLMKEVQGIDWGDAAIMNCKWKGPRLRDVLLHAGLSLDSASSDRQFHVAFASYQGKCQDDAWFEVSVPLEICLQEEREAVLALEVGDSLVYLLYSTVLDTV
jgi:sulfite oxidase